MKKTRRWSYKLYKRSQPYSSYEYAYVGHSTRAVDIVCKMFVDTTVHF
ncbi:MAG: hypothetical protein ACLSFR_09635 [Alphaproteobacteria bacterium]|nr:hypothetical protein [Alphaproteobacteria bacterium]